MDAMLKDRLTMIAALGAGVVVGISGIYMYYKLNQTVSQELNQLSGTIQVLKQEIEELKKSSAVVSIASNHRTKSEPKKKVLTDNTNGKVGSPNDSSLEDNDEFFDFSDSDDGVPESWASVATVTAETTHSVLDLPTSFLDEMDKLLDGTTEQKQKAYGLLRQREQEFDTSGDFYWRLSKACHFHKLTAQKEGDELRKKELSHEAYEAASKALELTNDNAEVHKWFAITLGALGEYVSVQDKVKNGYVFKEHVEIAVQIKPFDPTLHHLLGRWCYEVSILSWLERKVASMLFSEPPTATSEEARMHLLEADKLLPDWKENKLLLAKCFINEGDFTSAISWIDKACTIPNKAEDDELAHIELEALQSKYRSYR